MAICPLTLNSETGLSLLDDAAQGIVDTIEVMKPIVNHEILRHCNAHIIILKNEHGVNFLIPQMRNEVAGVQCFLALLRSLLVHPPTVAILDVAAFVSTQTTENALDAFSRS